MIVRAVTPARILGAIARIRRLTDHLSFHDVFGGEIEEALRRRVDALTGGADALRRREGVSIVTASVLLDLANVPKSAASLHTLVVWMGACAEAIEGESVSAADLRIGLAEMATYAAMLAELPKTVAA